MLEETEHYKRMDYELDAANAAAFGDADGYGLPPDGFGGIPPDEPYDDGIGFGGIPDQWEHQPMPSEPSPNEGFNPLNGFDPLGEEQCEIPEEYLANATEWGNQPFDPRDSLQFMQKDNGPVTHLSFRPFCLSPVIVALILNFSHYNKSEQVVKNISC